MLAPRGVPGPVQRLEGEVAMNGTKTGLNTEEDSLSHARTIEAPFGSKTWNWNVGVVPMYAALSGGIEAALEGTAGASKEGDGTKKALKASLMISGTVEIGIGHGELGGIYLSGTLEGGHSIELAQDGENPSAAFEAVLNAKLDLGAQLLKHNRSQMLRESAVEAKLNLGKFEIAKLKGTMTPETVVGATLSKGSDLSDLDELAEIYLSEKLGMDSDSAETLVDVGETLYDGYQTVGDFVANSPMNPMYGVDKSLELAGDAYDLVSYAWGLDEDEDAEPEVRQSDTKGWDAWWEEHKREKNLDGLREHLGDDYFQINERYHAWYSAVGATKATRWIEAVEFESDALARAKAKVPKRSLKRHPRNE